MPGSIARDGMSTVFRQSLGSSVRLERSTMVPRYLAALRGEPQIAVNALIHGAESVGADAGSIALVEDGEMHAIKPSQPVKGGNPEIPIRRLSDAANNVLGQTSVRRPEIKAVLRVGWETQAEQSQQ